MQTRKQVISKLEKHWENAFTQNIWAQTYYICNVIKHGFEQSKVYPNKLKRE